MSSTALEGNIASHELYVQLTPQKKHTTFKTLAEKGSIIRIISYHIKGREWNGNRVLDLDSRGPEFKSGQCQNDVIHYL